MEGSRKLKVAALGTASVVNLVGFATPAWAVMEVPGSTESHGYGLWQHCNHEFSGTKKCAMLGRGDPAWLRSAQVLECVGMLGFVISITISSVLKCFKHSVTVNHRPLTLINIVIICGTGICIIVGVAVFGASDFDMYFNGFEGQQHCDLGYSFFLCTGADSFLLLIYAPILLYDTCLREQPRNLRSDNLQDRGDIYSADITYRRY